MAKGLERRTELFNKFSNQLLLLKQHGIINTNFKSTRPYLCPICLIEFTENDLKDNSTNFLTLEDAPPYALGGSKIALTCKKCNSECGYKIDSHLSEVLKAIDASYFYKDSKHYRTVDFNGNKLNIELTSHGDGTLTAYHRTRLNNPNLLDKFIYGLKNKSLGPILNLDPPKKRFDSKRVNYALVKANYIITFSKFGYIFLLDKEYDAIRQQLLHPENEIYTWTPFIKDQFTNNQIGTYYLLNEGIESIFNIFSLKTKYSETLIGGLLPIPKISILQFTKSVQQQKDQNGYLTLNTSYYDSAADLFNNIEEINKILKWIE